MVKRCFTIRKVNYQAKGKKKHRSLPVAVHGTETLHKIVWKAQGRKWGGGGGGRGYGDYNDKKVNVMKKADTNKKFRNVLTFCKGLGC